MSLSSALGSIRVRRGCAAVAVLAGTALAAAGPAAGSATAAVAARQDSAAGGADRAARGDAAKPTVVLVHGAFADASSFSAVIQRLEQDGYPVLAPANPLRGLAEDAAYLAGFLKSIKGPIVLVGHSYGGAVISTAAAGNAEVASLVYVCALMPDKGEVLGELAAKFPGSQLDPALAPVPFHSTGGVTGIDLYLRGAAFHRVFAADVPAPAAAVMAHTQRPVSASAFVETATVAAWRTVPSWALVATHDKVIAPALERFEAVRAHAHTVEVASSHAAMVSHPEAVTDLIRTAARAASARRPAPPALATTGTDAGALIGLAATALASVLAGAGLIRAARRGARRTGQALRSTGPRCGGGTTVAED